MTKTGWLLSIVSILIIIAAIILFVLPGKTVAPTTNGEATTTPSTTATTTPAVTLSHPEVANMVVLKTLAAGASIASPLTIEGDARGGWYFEASFPVEIRNAAGEKIAEGPAEAQGEWMTENFVPFKISLTFPEQPTGSMGKVILRNDNASGLPENDRFMEIPVIFQ